jgi:hypothetical protein
MPHDADGAFMKQGSDSSPRLRLLSLRATPLPGQTVSVTEGEDPPPGRPGHSGTYRRLGAVAGWAGRAGSHAQIIQLWVARQCSALAAQHPAWQSTPDLCHRPSR